MKKIFLKLTLVLSLLSFSSMYAIADQKDDIRILMQKKIDTITLLLNQEINTTERNQKIIETLESIFNFKLMAKLSLGSKQWRSISDKEKSEFTDLFAKRIQNSYLEKLDLYTNEKIVVKEVKQIKNTRMHIITYLVSKNDKKEILYKFYRARNSGWWIYDVDILGVSVIQTYRSQFAEALRKESMEQLLNKMRSSNI